MDIDRRDSSTINLKPRPPVYIVTGGLGFCGLTLTKLFGGKPLERLAAAVLAFQCLETVEGRRRKTAARFCV